MTTTFKKRSAWKLWGRLVAVLGVVALGATSCLKYTTDIVVERDGSGTATVILALDPEASADFDSGGDTTPPTREEFCADQADPDNELPPEAAVTPYDDGKYCGMQVDFLIPVGGDLGATLADAAPSEDEDLTLVRTETGWDFRAPTGFTADDINNSSNPMTDTMTEAMLEDFEFTFRVSLPGIAGENNAQTFTVEGDHTVFFWDLKIQDEIPELIAVTVVDESSVGNGETAAIDGAGQDVDGNELAMASEGGSDDGGLPLGTIGGGLTVLMGLVAVGLVFASRSKANGLIG